MLYISPMKTLILSLFLVFASVSMSFSADMEFVFVKGGCFKMGDVFGVAWLDMEKTVHEVCVDDFHMGKYEVTFEQFREFADETGYKTEAEKSQGQWTAGCIYGAGAVRTWEKDNTWRDTIFQQYDRSPVICVSWNDSIAFTQWMAKKTGKTHRLPTEAEWEYAARSGGKEEKWAGTNNESELGDFAWYDENSDDKTHLVGKKRPNGLGLHDMTGNAWEWVQDWFNDAYYKDSPKDNPTGPEKGTHRSFRGGSWDGFPMVLRTTYRNFGWPYYRDPLIGFRVVRAK